VNDMKVLIAAAIAASVALCGAAGAKENYKEKTFNADSKDKFDAVATDVRKEMESGGRYQYVKAEERTKIDAALGEMTALFAASGSVASMNKRPRSSFSTIRKSSTQSCSSGMASGLSARKRRRSDRIFRSRAAIPTRRKSKRAAARASR